MPACVITCDRRVSVIPVCRSCDRRVSVIPVCRSSEEAQEFASLCIAREPHQRPSPSQLCPGGEADLDAAHPFIAVSLELNPKPYTRKLTPMKAASMRCAITHVYTRGVGGEQASDATLTHTLTAMNVHMHIHRHVYLHRHTAI